MSNPSIVIGVSAVDSAKQVLAGVDSKVAETAGKVESSNSQMSSSFDRLKQNFTTNAKDIAIGVTGLTAGIVSFTTSFSSLEKAQVNADRAQLMYNKSLERLKDLQTSGKASAEDLKNAHEQVRINAEKARLAQDDLSDTYTNFFAQIPAQLVSFGVSAVSIYNLLHQRKRRHLLAR